MGLAVFLAISNQVDISHSGQQAGARAFLAAGTVSSIRSLSPLNPAAAPQGKRMACKGNRSFRQIVSRTSYKRARRSDVEGVLRVAGENITRP